VKPGDAVRRGDIVAVVDTDKAEIEVEVWQDGVIDRILVPPGQKVPVGTVLATLRAVGAATTGEVEPAAVERVRATPLARRLARERGVDLASLAGSGPRGAVTEGDVLAATPAPAPPQPQREDRSANMRRAIAAAMARSKREIPHYYLETDLDFGAARAWLEAENLRRPVTGRLLPAALLVRAVALAARETPEVNGHFVDGAFRPAGAVHVGFAIALRGGGLIAPAIHDADQKDPGALMRELRDLVARTRGSGLRGSELTDATITVTSLGERGVERVVPVIYPPQVAIVGFGRVSERPWAAAGRVEVRPVISASLAADHRASDGERGARFLNDLARRLREPAAL
jgi:pyruvate dehydrogenase E2 component (dihydrolipoamide acetyltransferase)